MLVMSIIIPLWPQAEKLFCHWKNHEIPDELGWKKPHMTKGKRKDFKKPARQLVKTLKLTPAPHHYISKTLSHYTIIWDLFLPIGYRCYIPLLTFFHSYFNVGQRSWRVAQLPLNVVPFSWLLAVHSHKLRVIFW